MPTALLLAATIVAHPLANEHVLEPSVANEVEHALSRAPTAVPVLPSAAALSVLSAMTNGLAPSATAIRLVSAQGSDGRWLAGTNDYTSAAVPLLRELLGDDGNGTCQGCDIISPMKYMTSLLATAVVATACARPAPSPALASRLAEGIEIIGIVHWGLNTYTDREWGYGDEDPQMLDPKAFDAAQIVGACRDGGLQGLVVVSKHHDGFCLWPTKTTEHNISRSPFRGGKGDYVREMSDACRAAGLRFGVYVSPWDRNSAHYATEKYVEIYHEQIRELTSGAYGEVFEQWFDGANGGDGYYGGAREKRKIGPGYYRFSEIFSALRARQPKVCIFAGEDDTSEFRWPGNERGILDPDSRATSVPVGGIVDGKYLNPAYKPQINTGTPTGAHFRMCECDFPMRPGWFYHAAQRGKTKNAAYLMQRYLSSVGNGGTMNIGVSPNRDGLLDDEDVRALKGFHTIREAFFAKEVTVPGEPFNVVVLQENLAKGEQVDGWELRVDGQTVLSGKSIGHKRIRTLETPLRGRVFDVAVTADGGEMQGVTMRRYFADPELVKLVLSATTTSGETDTAKWMTGKEKERK